MTDRIIFRRHKSTDEDIKKTTLWCVVHQRPLTVTCNHSLTLTFSIIEKNIMIFLSNMSTWRTLREPRGVPRDMVWNSWYWISWYILSLPFSSAALWLPIWVVGCEEWKVESLRGLRGDPLESRPWGLRGSCRTASEFGRGRESKGVLFNLLPIHPYRLVN